MAITADLVKELRERTGSGMMECKKALVEADGDIELALENLRKKGSAQADKKAGNIAAEGMVVIKVAADKKKAAIAEINCQTDFVARENDFKKFADLVAMRALDTDTEDAVSLAELPVSAGSAETIEEQRRALVVKLGENIQIRRVAILQSGGTIGTYLHGDRIGVLVALSADKPDLGKDLSMHVAASRPRAISPEDISPSVIEKEREIFLAQVQGSGKPADIIDKIVDGKIKKFLSEETLLGQPFVKDPTQSIESLLKHENAKVLSFVRFEVGEGIERKVENFASEVMAQVRGSE